ncbi:MAG TPA: hypothetical protein VMS64_25760 [Candidatus Methylomirabilis sp.]|nr:hypothetical protein [Candidatus Methylomirabilis sp.]
MDWPTEFVGWDVQEAWVQSVANTVAWGIFGWGVIVATVLLLGMLAIRNRKRRFWCTEARCAVEVHFEDRGLPGFATSRVLSCSAFDPSTAVRCQRHCLDPDQRRPVAIVRRMSSTGPRS